MTPSTRAEKIDEQAEGLIKEFFEHYERIKNSEGEPTLDQRVVFEGWTIQKIAGLQVLIMELHDEIKRLHN
jgi:hypothetical protein